MPQHFANNGYRTAATGKIYHMGAGGGEKSKADIASKPEFQITAPYGGGGTKPPKKLIPPTPMGNHSAMEWGVRPLDNDDTDTRLQQPMITRRHFITKSIRLLRGAFGS